nr:MAG TPA: hypothetical protein [Caudoviricetes sp.]
MIPHIYHILIWIVHIKVFRSAPAGFTDDIFDLISGRVVTCSGVCLAAAERARLQMLAYGKPVHCNHLYIYYTTNYNKKEHNTCRDAIKPLRREHK